IWIYKDFEQFLSTFMEVGSLERFENRMDLPPDIEFMLSLGGDGTMLSAVSLLHDSEIPVTGINLGRLGFLASINKDNIEPAIVSLLKKEYGIERRTLLSVKAEGSTLFNGNSFALNDISILKRGSSAMITVSVYLNG